jgi:hypothetical protein
MNQNWKSVLLIAIAICSVDAFGKEKKSDPLNDTVKQINHALSKNDSAAAISAYARLRGIRANYDDKKLAPALAAVANGIGHKDLAIAQDAVETLGALRVRGSAKLLNKWLSPPPNVSADKIPLSVAALTAAGAIGDKGSLKALKKAVLNANQEIAVAAGRAFGGFNALDDKPLKALLKSMVKTLATLEKRAAGKDEKVKATAAAAVAALNQSLAKLTGKEGIGAAQDWAAYLKQRAKEAKAA